MQQLNMLMQTCNLCDCLFIAGDKVENIGATYEDGSRENLFAHVGCIEIALTKYRTNKLKIMDRSTFEHDTARATATIKQTVELLKKPDCKEEYKKDFLDVIEKRANELQSLLDDSYAELRKKDDYLEACKVALQYFDLHHLSNSVIATSLREVIKNK